MFKAMLAMFAAVKALDKYIRDAEARNQCHTRNFK